MRFDLPDRWPDTVAEALAVQDRLRPLVDTRSPGPARVRYVAGVDVAYSNHSDRIAAAVVVLDYQALAVVDQAMVTGTARFAYHPGLLAFRELPLILPALARLRIDPDLIVCDGHGTAHPRRIGLASHLGVLTGVSTLGAAKTPYVGTTTPPDPDRGAWTPIRVDGQVVGRTLRTRTGIKPVYVSPGHRITLDAACTHVLHLTPRYRLPETTRHADHTARQALTSPQPR